MTTLTLNGIFITNDINDNPTSVNTTTFEAAFPNTSSFINYSLLPTPPGDLLPMVDIGGSPVASATVNGIDVLSNDSIEASIGFIETAAGIHVMLAFFDPVTNTDAIFQIGGDPLTLPTSPVELATLEASITNSGPVTGAFAPGVDIPITNLGGALSGDPFNVVQGTDGDDILTGTAGDDLIVTGDNPGGDVVVGSAGNDTIDFSGITDNPGGFVSLDYTNIGAPISVQVDGFSNAGNIIYGPGNTFDTLVNVADPLAAGWTTGGLEILATSGNDSFNLHPDGQQWMSIRPGDGTDSFDIFRDGLVRIDMIDGNGINVNLATGTINDDGFGNAETIGGPGAVWEIRGSGGDDTFVGSGNGESYRYTGGNNTLDGGAGFDRLRYDSSGVSSVEIDAANGVVNGVVNGIAFTDTISGFERLRGSFGDDLITGEAGVDNRYEGRGGDDSFVHLGGNDTISDFDPFNETLIVRVAGLDQAEFNAAMGAPTDTTNGAQITFGSGSVTFSGLTTADLFGADVRFVDVSSPVNTVQGTDGDDLLFGTQGSDLIITGDNTGADTVVPSVGDDTIDFSGITANPGGAVELDYGGSGMPVNVTIDGATNTGSAVSPGLGTDTFVNVVNPLAAGWTTGGLVIGGSFFDDTFNVAPDGQQWMSIRPGEGTDTLIINGTGLVRIDMSDAFMGIDVNLATRTINDDGFGNTEIIGGTGAVWEIMGTFDNDTFVGSGNGESYRYTGGNNTLDGGAGFDRLRYDSFGVSSVEIDAANGVVNGVVNGIAFTDTISGFERLRGSGGDDTITGEAGVDNRYEGLGGTDRFTHLGGNDTISDFDPTAESLTVRLPASSFLALQAAIANASDTADGAVVDFGGGNSITFTGLTAAQVAGISADTGGPTEGADTLIGTAGADIINGLGGDDLIEGGDGADNLFGGDGNDTLDGGTGPNGLFGGNGDDILSGGIGWEDIFGGAGNDTILAFEGNDNIGGGAGLDLIFASDGDDIVFGGDDNDTIWGGLGDDQIGGGNGADQINAGPGNDVVWGGVGDDLIDGGDGTNNLAGGDGNDTITSGSGDDALWGGLGNDVLTGGAGNDTLGGFDGDDVLEGGAGNDNLWGALGNDTILGGDGADVIGGDTGNDSIEGGAGNDTVFAADGLDIVRGGAGDDLLFAGGDDDRLAGGTGNDTLWGGTGADVFEFNPGDGADVFEFFNIGAGDRIELDTGLLGGAATGTDIVNTFASVSGGNAVLDFGGGDTITLTGVTTLAGLDSVFDIV